MHKEMSGRYNPRSGCMKAPLIAIILLLTSAASILVYSEPLVVPPSRENSSDGSTGEDLSYRLAEQLISLLGPSREQTIAALYGIEGDEELSESVSEILLSGEEATAEALALFDEGSYEEAMELATTAMQLYGDAIRTAVEAELEEDGEDAAEEEAMGSIELGGEIERVFSYLDKVRKTVTRLEKKGLDVSVYEALVDEAEEHLLRAEEMLDDDDVEGAEAEESVAMEILDEVMGLLRRESEESKAGKASKFLEKTAERLEKLEDRITEKIGGLDSGQEATIHQAFQDAKNENQEIKSMIEAGEIDAGLGRFKEVLEDEDDALGVVESLDEVMAKNLKTITKIEAKQDRLEEKLEGLKEDDSDDVDPEEDGGAAEEGFEERFEKLGEKLREKIEKAEEKSKEAREKIERAVSSLEDEEVDDAEDAVEETEELVEEVEDEIEDRKKEKRTRIKRTRTNKQPATSKF